MHVEIEAIIIITPLHDAVGNAGNTTVLYFDVSLLFITL